MKRFLLISTLLLTLECELSFAQCNGGGIWTGGTPVAGTLTAQGTIQGGVNVTARSTGSFASGRPQYNRVNNTYNGFSYRSLTVIRGGANPFSSASTSFKLSTPLSSSYIHFRVSDVRGDGFNAEPQRIRGYNNGVEVSATFEDAVNGAYISSGNIINGASTTTSTVQSAIRIFFTGPVDSVVLTKTNGGDYVIFDLFSRCDIVLPFQLNGFSASIHSSAVNLKWETSAAWNFEWFDVERSPDAVNWSMIGKKNINDYSEYQGLYRFTDDAPLTGRNYYRLRSTDADGKVTLSAVVSVNFQKPVPDNNFRISPNPVQEIFRLSFLQEEPSLISCFAPDGRIVYSTKSSSKTFSINTSTWRKGLYFIRIQFSSGRQETARILKK